MGMGFAVRHLLAAAEAEDVSWLFRFFSNRRFLLGMTGARARSRGNLSAQDFSGAQRMGAVLTLHRNSARALLVDGNSGH